VVQSPPSPPPPEEEEEIIELTPVDPNRSGLPRIQLELEYRACLQEREMLLNQLAGVLEELMLTVPAD
jgi:hypothetical protein